MPHLGLARRPAAQTGGRSRQMPEAPDERAMASSRSRSRSVRKRGTQAGGGATAPLGSERISRRPRAHLAPYFKPLSARCPQSDESRRDSPLPSVHHHGSPQLRFGSPSVRSRWPSTIRKARPSSAGSIGPHTNSAQARALTTTGSSGSAASRNRASGDPRFNMRIRRLVSKWIIAVRRRIAERTRSESRPLGVPTHPNLRLGPRLIPEALEGLATSRPPVTVAARLRYGSLFEAPRISRHSSDAPTLPACGPCQRQGSTWT